MLPQYLDVWQYAQYCILEKYLTANDWKWHILEVLGKWLWWSKTNWDLTSNQDMGNIQ